MGHFFQRLFRQVQLVPVQIAGVLLMAAFSGLLFHQVGRDERNQQLKNLESRLDISAGLRADMLSNDLNRLKQDARFLAQVPAVDGMVRSILNGGYDQSERTPGKYWKRRLQVIFSSFMKENPDFVQMRFIGLAGGGMELVRVERKLNNVVNVPDGQLQHKSDREYFRSVLALKKDQVYVSDINLNREGNQVDIPRVITVRASTPVFAPDGTLFGMVVINLDLKTKLTELSSNLSKDMQIYLTNSDGDYLLQADAEKTFGFDLGRRWRWQDEQQRMTVTPYLPVPLQQFQSTKGVVQALQRRVSLDEIHAGRYVTITLAQPDRVVAAAVLHAQILALLIAFGCAAVVTGIVYIIFWQRQTVDVKQAELAAIAESSHDAIIGKDLEGRVTSWNSGACDMFGYRADEAVGRKLADLIVPPELIAEEVDILHRMSRGERVNNLKTRRRTKDGCMVDVSVMVSPIKNKKGEVVGAAKTVRDISEQMALESKLLDLNADLERQVIERTAEIKSNAVLQKSILNNAGFAVCAVDISGMITVFNPAAERMLGYRNTELIGKASPVLFHDFQEITRRAAELSVELGSAVEPGFQVFTAKAMLGMSDEQEWTYVCKNGQRVPVLLSMTAMRGVDGEIFGFLGLAIDLTERRAVSLALTQTRDQLLMAAKVAGLGIWTWNIVDDTLRWNDWMYITYDQPVSLRNGGLGYEHWLARIHPEDVDRTISKLNNAVAGEGIFDPVFRVVRTNGEIRYLKSGANIERDETGKPVLLTGINFDITEHIILETSLREAKELSDAASRAKSEFLANMSHEIRTPMNAVLGMLYLLQQTGLNLQQVDYAAKAENSARTLLSILNDILDFSRVEAGKLAIDLHPFSLDQMLRNIGTILSANLGSKDVNILFEIDQEVPDCIVGDGLRLQQILINLAGNAVKFTEHGEVVLAVALAERKDNRLSITFAVRDTGIGISPEQCERIFEGFSQAEASTARRYGGSGLGLAISQRLVHLMQGTLSVSSKVGQGSTFYFTVDCEASPEPVAIPETFDMVAPKNLHGRETLSGKPVLKLRRMAGLRILVVEDNPINRQISREMLASEGAEVQIVDCGQDGVDAVRNASSQFDIVLMDIQMPDMDGYGATRLIRLHYPKDVLPIVAITANAMQSDRQSALEAGMNDHVGKPFNLNQLVAVILLHTQRNSTLPVAGPDQIVEYATVLYSGLDTVTALQRLNGNGKAYRSVLKGFVNSAAETQAAFDRALQGQYHADVRRILHTLKGLAGTIGADKLAQRVQRLEMMMAQNQTIPLVSVLQDVWDALALACSAAQQYLSDNEPESDPVVAPLICNNSELRAGLVRLQRLTGMADLSAEEQFEQLQSCLKQQRPQACAVLKSAMEALNYEHACTLCDALIIEIDQQSSKDHTAAPGTF